MSKSDQNSTYSQEEHQALSTALHSGFKYLKLTCIILILLYGFSGIFAVKTYENAYILRFGKIVGKNQTEQIIKSGEWHWAWPAPIDKVIRIPVKMAETIHINHYWYKKNPMEHTESQSLEEAEKFLIPGIDGYLLTGDRNILHAKWSLTYLITNPVTYLSSYKYPKETIKRVLQNSIVKETAKENINNALYGNAEQLRSNVQREVAKLINEMPLGISVKNVSYIDKAPPKTTVNSFNRLSEAVQEKGQKINAAYSTANKIIQESKGKSVQFTTEAESYKIRAVASIKADEQYFKSILTVYDNAPETMLINLYSKTLTDILGKVDAKYIIHANNNNESQEIRLLLGPEHFKKR